MCLGVGERRCGGVKLVGTCEETACEGVRGCVRGRGVGV